LFGKKEFAQLSIVDLVFILLISNSVQTAMVGTDTSLEGGLVAALALFVVNFIFKKLTIGRPEIAHLIDGDPVLLVYNGQLKAGGLAKAQITIEQLESVIREHGVEDISEVDLAMFEVDGNISVISDNFKKTSRRRRKGHRILGNNAT
jgi:uncharacterized membrane protein YcaP (DUF421 family)